MRTGDPPTRSIPRPPGGVRPASPESGRTAHRLRVVEAALLLTMIGIQLRVLPFQRVVGQTRWMRTPAGGDGGDGAARQATCPVGLDVARAVTAAARRLPWRPVCLPQALAITAMLRRRGRRAEIRFSVGRNGPARISAHAWVVLTGGNGGVLHGGDAAIGMVPIAALDRQAGAPPLTPPGSVDPGPV